MSHEPKCKKLGYGLRHQAWLLAKRIRQCGYYQAELVNSINSGDDAQLRRVLENILNKTYPKEHTVKHFSTVREVELEARRIWSIVKP